MQKMVKGVSGNYLRIMAQEDISNNVNQIELDNNVRQYSPRLLSEEDGVIVGTEVIIKQGITFETNQYVSYMFKLGDIEHIGIWKAALISVTPDGKRKILRELEWEVI